MKCLLCSSADTRVIDRFSYADLKRLYFRTCKIDIDSCVDRPYTEEFVVLYGCNGCDLEFYPPALQGNQRLYEAFGKLDFYYGSEKWEFGAALKDSVGAAALLEIGCGNGMFLRKVIASTPAIDVTGLETNPTASAEARKAGLNVEPDLIEDFAKAHRAEFDRVCAFQVLEHVARPDMFLENSVKCLKPGGLLMIGVPNADGFTRDAINNFGDMPPHHLTRWTGRVMKNVARQFGLKLESVQYEPVADYHKEWFRNTRTVLLMSRLLGWKFKRLDVGLRYQFLLSLSHRLKRIAPDSFWQYDRYPGHTLYAAFRA